MPQRRRSGFVSYLIFILLLFAMVMGTTLFNNPGESYTKDKLIQAAEEGRGRQYYKGGDYTKQ